MKKDLGKKEITVEVDDNIEDQDPGLPGGNSGVKEVSKDNMKFIASLFLLVVLILMGIVHANIVAILITGVVLGILIYKLYKKNGIKTT